MTRVALITGGQTGIGFGVAQALADAGFRVALAGLSAPNAPETEAALAALGAAARYFPVDLSDIAAHAPLLDAVERDLGPITTLVSNAGVPAKTRGDMLDMAPESFDAVMGVNLRGAFFLAQETARRMLTRPAEAYRSLLFVTSVSAEMASIERAEYCLSKSAGAMMTKLFALRLAPETIGVFELRPGIIETGMTAAVKDAYDARIEGGLVPAGRWGQPQDIGAVAVPLAEGRFAFATGATIPVDGGLSLPRL